MPLQPHNASSTAAFRSTVTIHAGDMRELDSLPGTARMPMDRDTVLRYAQLARQRVRGTQDEIVEAELRRWFEEAPLSGSDALPKAWPLEVPETDQVVRAERRRDD